MPNFRYLVANGNGGFMLTPLPGATPTKPGSATRPFPGILADVVDLEGNPVEMNQGAIW